MLISGQTSARPSSWLQAAAVVVAAVGVFIGFLVGAGTPGGQRTFCLTIGVIGLLAFGRHNVTAASDAARLGFTGGHRGYQYEVGFANAAFGITGLLVAAVDWGPGARLAALVSFAVYLLAVLAYQVRRTTTGDLRGGRAAMVLSSTAGLGILLLVAAAFGASTNHLWPFPKQGP